MNKKIKKWLTAALQAALFIGVFAVMGNVVNFGNEYTATDFAAELSMGAVFLHFLDRN